MNTTTSLFRSSSLLLSIFVTGAWLGAASCAPAPATSTPDGGSSGKISTSTGTNTSTSTGTKTDTNAGTNTSTGTAGGTTTPVLDSGSPEASTGHVPAEAGAEGGQAPVQDSGACDACAAQAIYVSPTGSDNNPGTFAEPVQTLSEAADRARSRLASMTSDLVVYLRGGTYPVTSTVTFGNADSGQNGFYVKYMAYPGERPVITGGQPITGWALSDATNGVYSVSGVTARFRQLYVNGVKAVRARSPNLGANGAANFWRISGNDNNAQNIQVSSSYVSSWGNFTKVEMHIMIGWGDATLRLASSTTQGNTAYLSIQSPESTIVFVRPNPALGGQFGGGTKHAFYFENAREFLDQPGEWYLDETANVLYYKPRSGEDMSSATVVAPVVETVLSVVGTSPDSQAGYLWFQGLSFAHSTYMLPSQSGFIDGQAGQYNTSAMANNDQTVGRPAAGVSVTNANHIHFEQNLFTQMAATGLDFVSGTHDDTIVGNAFTDIGGSGISIGKFTANDTTEYHIAYNPTDKNEICQNDTITDNYIDTVTTEIQGACGIAAGYPAHVDIEHNEVGHTNYTGISVGFGWTSSPNAMTDNTINYNNVHNVVQVLADGASIYTLSNQQPTSSMLYNYIHDYQTSTWADYGDNGLYMDEQTSGYTVEHNLMVNAPTNVVQNKNGTNTVMDNGTNPSMASSTMATAGIEPAYGSINEMTLPPLTF
jgi:hypothetical protein